MCLHHQCVIGFLIKLTHNFLPLKEMCLINNEQNLAKKYLLEVDGGCVVLSLENVAKAEAMLLNDSNYSKARDVNAGPTKGYKGSTAYWMTKLKESLDNKIQDAELRVIIKYAVLAVDRENSTHISSDGVGADELTNRIFSNKDTLIDKLRNRKQGFDFIKFLAKETTPVDKKHHPRKNYSFATKFCHYACFYFFKGEEEQDNYSIYDKVVSRVLPLYLRKRNIGKENGEYMEQDFGSVDKYETYSNLIDELREGKISRNGFDHLLWYYHKSRP